MPIGVYNHPPQCGFQKGHIGWNKGKKGYTNEGSFKKGFKPWNKGKGKNCRCKECKKMYRKFYNMSYRMKNSIALSNKNKYDPKRKYVSCKAHAKKSRLIFNISLDDFKKIISNPCQYCGDKIDMRSLDRVNNDKGYTLDNVVSCCAFCNYIKRDLTIEEFKFRVSRIYNYFIKK